MERVFEYERWRAELNPAWGNSSAYLLPMDPGRWSDSGGEGAEPTFAWTLDEVRERPLGCGE